MQGTVYLKHKISNPKPVYEITGDLRWYSNDVIRVFNGTVMWEIPRENIAAIVFEYKTVPEVKNETKKP